MCLVHTEQSDSDDRNGSEKFGIHTKSISRRNERTAVRPLTFRLREWEWDPLPVYGTLKDARLRHRSRAHKTTFLNAALRPFYDALLTVPSIFA